jgi:hypothetical protein
MIAKLKCPATVNSPIGLTSLSLCSAKTLTLNLKTMSPGWRFKRNQTKTSSSRVCNHKPFAAASLSETQGAVLLPFWWWRR